MILLRQLPDHTPKDLQRIVQMLNGKAKAISRRNPERIDWIIRKLGINFHIEGEKYRTQLEDAYSAGSFSDEKVKETIRKILEENLPAHTDIKKRPGKL